MRISLPNLVVQSSIYMSLHNLPFQCKSCAYTNMLIKLLSAFLLCVSSGWAYVVNNGTTCYVYPESLVYSGLPVDDTPSILQAFDLCGINGSVVFTDDTFYVDQVMNTTNLLNCNVDIYGTLIWSTNIPYWLSHSISVVYQDQ